MKKLTAFLLTICACAFVASCTAPKNDDSSSTESSVTSSSEQAQTFTVTFKQAGAEDVVKTVKNGEALTDIPTPKAKTGYTVAWEVSDFSSITSNLTVNAVETANTYVVTYDANGGTVANATQNVVFDEETTLLTPEREDYLFLGWTYQGNAVVNSAKWSIASDVTLVANWQDNRPNYKVTFVDGTKGKEVTVKKGESVNASDVPAFEGKVGYTAVWDKTDLTNIQVDTTVTAVYTANTYTVTYDADGFAIDGTTAQLTYDAVCSVLDMSLTKTDYRFLGWKYGENTYTNQSVWNVASDVTLTADWVLKEKAVVTFVDTNGATVNKNVNVGETLTDIPTPTLKTGYNVDVENWYADEDCTILASFENVQDGFIVYAKATPKTYEITYNANGGILADTTQDVVYDEEYTLYVPTHEKSYMRFDGWMDASGNVVSATGVWKMDNTLSLTAKWTDTRETFTVSFVQKDQQIKTFSVKEGDAFTQIPACAEKKGYVVSWDETAIAKLSSVTENVEVVAVETAKTFTIVFDVEDDWTKPQSVTVTYDKAYAFEKPSHDDYIFLYWTYNGEKVDINGVWNIDSNSTEIKLVAKYQEGQWTDFY